jgi:IS1 family transposase
MVLRKACPACGANQYKKNDHMMERIAACPDDLPQWIWIAMDATNRQSIVLHVGDKSRDSAKELWAKTPLVYRE